MKKMLHPLFFLAVLIVGCTDDAGSPSTLEAQTIGQWLWVEYGNSPGAGYNVTQVPPAPKLTVTIHPNNKFFSTVPTLSGFSYYKLKRWEHTGDPILVLYHNETEAAANVDENRYLVVFDDGKLELHYIGCIEGCHLGFRRLPLNSTGE